MQESVRPKITIANQGTLVGIEPLTDWCSGSWAHVYRIYSIDYPAYYPNYDLRIILIHLYNAPFNSKPINLRWTVDLKLLPAKWCKFSAPFSLANQPTHSLPGEGLPPARFSRTTIASNALLHLFQIPRCLLLFSQKSDFLISWHFRFRIFLLRCVLL